MAVLGCFLGGPGGRRRDVFDVIRLPLGLHHPRWDRGVLNAGFVEVEHHLTTIAYLEHVAPFRV